ncbi:transcriptional regulatory Pro-1 [Fusarium albosuccineum]|uniref:Transcriptional regulatory Pro-1 n=1 Tax=Fusarium albosuccineum TaxID=1237068 RepID=A0A8H4LAM1_9HYPO|nr:transcriptional regulatory Pro-1 [Fusarium albosuccineum]
MVDTKLSYGLCYGGGLGGHATALTLLEPSLAYTSASQLLGWENSDAVLQLAVAQHPCHWCNVLGAMARRTVPANAVLYGQHLKMWMSSALLKGSADSFLLCQEPDCGTMVVYLISEIAVFEWQTTTSRMEHGVWNSTRELLEDWLARLEQIDTPTSSSPFGCVITAFRMAARIYFHSFTKEYGPFSHETQVLVGHLTEVLQETQMHPVDYDYHLIWVYLVAGSNCAPTSPFRDYFHDRLHRYRQFPDLPHCRLMELISTILEETWDWNDNTRGSIKDWRDVMLEYGLDLFNHLVHVPLLVNDQ